MQGFAVEHEQLGTHPVIALVDAARSRTVRIARHGATVLSMRARAGERTLDLADGYRDEDELLTRPGSRFAFMAPFANRIADARYRFDGVEYDLAPGVIGADRAARHGFLRDVDFAVEDEGADADRAWLVLSTDAIRPGVHPGYPFAIDVAVRFTLDRNGLSLAVTMRNVGDRAAPCFFGWHPYFRVGDGALDDWELTVPAQALIATDDTLVPVPGAAAYQPIDDAPERDFRTPRPIGPVHLDQGYARLLPDADGRLRARLRDPASGVGLSMWHARGITLAFSADTVPRDARRALALEPMESLTDAFNRPDCADAIRLEAGVERRFDCGVVFELP